MSEATRTPGDRMTFRSAASLFAADADADGAMPADRPDLHRDPSALAPAIGAGLAALHAVPLAPPAGAIEPEAGDLSVIAADLDESLIDAEALPEPYSRYTAQELVAFAQSSPAVAPQLAWCHGSPTLDRFLVAEGRFVSFAKGGDPSVQDRHLDLAIAQRSLTEILGPAAVIPFYEAYGEPNLLLLDQAMLIVLLAGSRHDG